MVTIEKQPQQFDEISGNKYSWFAIFLLLPETGQRELNLRCLGCRELVELNFNKPAHISGVIEFNGREIPVIDPDILLLGWQSPLSNLSSIIIVPHKWQNQQFYTGIIINDIDEMMELVSCEPDLGPLRDVSINIKFVLDLRKSPGADSWLYENHQLLEICRNEGRLNYSDSNIGLIGI